MLGNLIRFNEPTGFEWQASAGDGFLQSSAGAAARREGGKELCVKDVETLSKRQAVRPPTHVAAFTSLYFCILFFVFYLRTFQRHNVALLSRLPRSKDVHTRLIGSSCASVCASGQSLRPLEGPSFTPGRCTRTQTLYCCSFAATFASFLLVSEEAIPLIKVSMRLFCFVRFLVRDSENLKKNKEISETLETVMFTLSCRAL